MRSVFKDRIKREQLKKVPDLGNFRTPLRIISLYVIAARYGTRNTLLRLVDESDKLKTNRKAKLCFEPVELSVIRRCLFDWRNQQVQAEKETAVEVIGELLKKVL